MAHTKVDFEQQCLQWSTSKVSTEQIMDSLLLEGYESESIEEIIGKYKKYLLEIRTRKGLLFMAIGAVLGFLSCIFTVYNVFPDFRDFFLYGLTSIAVVVVFLGCYFVFE